MRSKTRKLMWSLPLVATLAIVGALAAFMALAPGGLFANELPNNPESLVINPASGSAGRTTLVLTWGPPAGGETATGYRIDVSEDNDKYKFLAMTDANTRTYTHSGIKGSDEGVTRYYRVFAMNSHGSGKVSTSESGTTNEITPPKQVKPFNGSSSDPTKIELTWTAPDGGGAPILGYCIRAWPTGSTGSRIEVNDENCTDAFSSDGPGVSDEANGGVKGSDYLDSNDLNTQTGGVIRITPAASYTHKDLLAGQKWSYQIYAVNRYGQSDTVSETRDRASAAAKAPTPPSSLLAVQAESSDPE